MRVCPIINRTVTVFILVVLFAGFSAVSARSSLHDQLSEDFKVLSGYIVKKVGDDFIVDLDRSSGLVKGDVFSVLGAGEQIVHPVTGKIVGTLDTVKGFLKVIRLKKGYSFARRIKGSKTFKAGDPLRRYENTPALFWDYTGKGRNMSQQVESLLPHLQWQDFDTAQHSKPKTIGPPGEPKPALYFILTDMKLEVRGTDFVPLHVYEIKEPLVEKDNFPPAIAPAVTAVGKTTKPEPPVFKTEMKNSYSVLFEGSRTVGNISGVTLMADFVDVDNRLLMAGTDGLKIFVYEVKDRLKQITTIDIPVPGRILTVKWWEPVKTRLYLAVNTWYDHSIHSMIFAFGDNRLGLAADKLKRILGTFDLDTNGSAETLMGQKLDREEFFGRDIRQLALINGKIRMSRPKIKLPGRFTVVGGTITDLTGDGKVEAVFIRGGILYIYNGKKQLYASAKKMGGSLSYLIYDIDSVFKDVKTIHAFMEVSPLPADLDGDGRPDLLAIASNLPSVSSPGMGIKPTESQLTVLKFKEGRFIKGSLGEQMEMGIQGITVFNNRVLFVVSTPESLLGKEGSSHLLDYPLEMQ